MVTALEASTNLKKDFRTRVSNPKKVWGCPYGLPRLDEITGGIHSAELLVLIADTNVGKSSLAGQWAQNVASWLIRNAPKREVRIFTFEMSGEAYQKRMASSRSMVPLNRVKDGFVNQAQQDAYEKALDELALLPIRYIDQVESLGELQSMIRAEMDGKKCAWWVLDHFHIAPTNTNVKSEVEGLNGLSKMLTHIAQKTCPGLVLAQMNKDSLRRADKRPQIPDIRNNTSLGNNADWVYSLYREDMYVRWPEERKSDPRPAELNILKSRDGERALIDLDFYPDRGVWLEQVRSI